MWYQVLIIVKYYVLEMSRAGRVTGITCTDKYFRVTASQMVHAYYGLWRYDCI